MMTRKVLTISLCFAIISYFPIKPTINFVSAAQSTQTVNLTLEDFMAEADVADAEISPNGRYLALIFNKNEYRHVVIRDIEAPGQPITGMMKEKIIRPVSVYWANNERLLVNLLVPANAKRVVEKAKQSDDFDINDYKMYGRTISINVNAKDSVMLMNDQRRLKYNRNLSVIRNFIPDDPNHILMPGYGRGRRELYKVNVYTGESERIARGNRFTYAFLSDREGVPKYRYDFLRITKAIDIFEYTDDDEWVKVERIDLSGEDEDDFDSKGLIGLFDDDKLVFRRRNVETGYYELLIREKGSDKTEVLASLPDQDIRSVVSSRGTDEILGYTVEKDFIRYRLFDKDLQKSYDELVEQVGNYNFFVYSSRVQEKRAIIKSYGPDDPGTFYIYDYETKILGFLANQFSKLAPENLSIPALVNYKARDGERIRAYVLLPTDYQGKLPMPMVVLPHGGPQARDRASYDDFAQYISTRGYIVIKPNFRGSTGYGKTFEEAGYGEWGGLMQDDVTDAVNFMVKSGYTDTKSICIAGISYGGYSALMGSIKTPELYQCAISIAGVSHLEDQIEFFLDNFKGDEEKLEKILYRRIGNPEKDLKKLEDNSPALQADKVNIPILLIAGDDDKTVSYEQTELMFEALEDKKKSVELLHLKDTGHNVFYYDEDREAIYKKVTEFLNHHLRDRNKNKEEKARSE
jgi:dipeptidyl aminopeptidase/acylaminoacyl peptidase